MSPTKAPTPTKSNVVVLGGGYGGLIAAKELSAKLDHTKTDLYLVDARPHHVWCVSSARLTVSRDTGFANTAVLPFDRVFAEGKGVVKQGRVVEIRENKGGVGGELVFQNGDKLDYDVLVLATGSKWAGPLSFPDGKSDHEVFVRQWTDKFRDAKDVTLIGAGAVGIEFAGELRDEYPEKKITLIHSQPMVMNEAYPEKFRKYFGDQIRGRGIDLILGDFVESHPNMERGEVVLRSGRKLTSDLVVLTAGPKPNTDFIGLSFGEKALSEDGFVKVTPNLQLPNHPSIFAMGDIIDWAEQKQAAKIGTHADVVVGNVIDSLNGKPPSKVYKGYMEFILVTHGKNYGASYFPVLWGIVLGPWLTSRIKSANVFRGLFHSRMGYATSEFGWL